MRSALAVLLLASLPAPAVADPPAAEAAVKARVAVLLAAVTADDPDRVMAGWPEKDRTVLRPVVDTLRPPKHLTQTITDPEFSRWKAGETELTVRVRVVVVWKDRTGKDVNRELYALNARFVKAAAGWQWAACTEAVADVVAAIGKAGTSDEAIRLVRDNADLLPSRLFAISLIEQFDLAFQGGRLDAAKRIHQALGEAAAAGADPSAAAWVGYAFGRVLTLAGERDKAVAEYEAALARFRKLDNWLGGLAVRAQLVELFILAGRFDAALKQADAAVELARAVDRPDRLVTALHNRGLTLRALGRFADAAADFRAALRIARDRKDLAQEGEVLLGLGDVERGAGNPAAAARALEAALAIAAKTGNKRLEPYALTGLALIALDEARYDDARAGFRKALELFVAAGDLRMVPGAMNGLGMVAFSRGAVAEALNQFQATLALADQLGSTPGAVAALTNIGLARQRLGQYADALAAVTAALDKARAAGDRPNQALAHLNLGALYADMGQFALAEEHWRASSEIARRVGDRATAARALNNLGLCHLAAGHLARARDVFLGCQKVAREAGQFSSEVVAASNLAYLANKEGKGDEAVRALRELLARVEKVGNRPDAEKLRVRIAQILLRNGKTDEAGRAYAELLPPAGGDPSYLFEARLGLGEVARLGGRPAEAIPHYRAAVAAAERIRRGTRDPELQMSHFQRFANPFGGNPYAGLALCLAARADAEGAFATSERARGRALTDLLRDERPRLGRGLTPEERRQEQDLVRVLAERTNVWEAAAARPPGPGAVELAGRELKAAQTDLTSFHRLLYLRHPGAQTARAEFAPATPRELGAALFRDRPGLVVLSYLVAPDQTLVFVLTGPAAPGGPARLAVHAVPVTADRLAAAVEEFVEGCSQPGLVPTSDDLVRWLLDPAEGAVRGAAELVIVPDGVLHRLPFHALGARWGGTARTYLIQRCPVSYAPSATALVKMTELADRRRAGRSGPGSVLAVGIRDFGQRAKPLPAAEPEVRAVETLFRKATGRPAEALLGPAATKTNIRARWAGRRYLHFATHGDINWASPLFSSILVRPDGADEGRLYARDLLDAELTAELVVLSACQTGLGRVVGGEGTVGMSWSWFVAGVPSLVVSQWNVADESTARLMGEFYGQLLGGATKAEALRRAQLALLGTRATRHPFFWAPFVLLGDAGK